MIRIALIGRNVPGKGFDTLYEILPFLSDFSVRFDIFSDFFPNEILNRHKKLIKFHGWLNSDEIWLKNFDFVLLPMTAPETFSYSLHESIKNKKFIIVNGRNMSLKTQLDNALFYFSNEGLVELICQLSSYNLNPTPPILVKKRNLWSRIF